MHDIARYNWGLSNKIDTIRLRKYKDSFPIVLLPNLLNTFKIAKILLILISKIQYLHSANSCCLRVAPWIAVKSHFAHTTAVEQPRAIRGSTACEPVKPRLTAVFCQLISRQYCITELIRSSGFLINYS
jgi:hypothetical protein